MGSSVGGSRRLRTRDARAVNVPVVPRVAGGTLAHIQVGQSVDGLGAVAVATDIVQHVELRPIGSTLNTPAPEELEFAIAPVGVDTVTKSTGNAIGVQLSGMLHFEIIDDSRDSGGDKGIRHVLQVNRTITSRGLHLNPNGTVRVPRTGSSEQDGPATAPPALGEGESNTSFATGAANGPLNRCLRDRIKGSIGDGDVGWNRLKRWRQTPDVQ